jgi:hypothetical protein
MIRRIFLAFLIFLFSAVAVYGQFAWNMTPVDTTAWTVNLSAANIPTGAGGDFTTPIQSSANLVDIDLTLLTSNPWTLTIERLDTVWDADAVISAAVTSVGTAGGSGGGYTSTATYGLNVFSPITTVAKTFISGKKIRNDIRFQYQLSGHSVGTVPPGNYSTTIIYTLIN